MIKDRGPFRRAALKGYISQMSTPNPKGIFDDVVADILVEQGFSINEDPRSIYEPKQLYDALERYASEQSEPLTWDKHIAYGFRKAFKYFAKPKDQEPLKILKEVGQLNKALKMSKSSGLPLMTSKLESLTYSYDRESQIRLGLKAPNPCVAYKRTQKGNKTRLVWGYPLEMTIMEARFARPIIDWFTCHPSPMAFGQRKLDLGAKLHRYFEDEAGTTVCLDYSKYDTSIPRSFIIEAFRIIGTWFTQEDKESFGFSEVVRYFISTPIVMPDGHLYTGKDHGVPSGSYFTQMVDSIVNVALCYALSSKFKFFFPHRSLLVLGDDSIMQVFGKVDLVSWRKYLETFGMHIHDDEKTIVGKVHFLGALWKKGKPDADVDELASKAVFPEKYRRYGEQRYRGAEQVLRSYAANYVSGWRLIPESRRTYFYLVDKPYGFDYEDIEYMTGSDRFLAEEATVRRSERREGHDASLCQRLLL